MRWSLGGVSILSWLPLEVLVKIQAKLSRHHQERGCITVVTVMKKYLKHCFFDISDSIMIRTGKNGNVLVLRVV